MNASSTGQHHEDEDDDLSIDDLEHVTGGGGRLPAKQPPTRPRGVGGVPMPLPEPPPPPARGVPDSAPRRPPPDD